MKNQKNPEFGQLKVWHMPQVPMKVFEVFVDSVEEGVKVMDILADYDIFQFENRVKPDFCNANGLMIYVKDNGEDEPGWVDWYHEDTGEDAREYLKRIADEENQRRIE